MAYKLTITEHADELLDNLLYHLLFRLKNEQAAQHLLSGIENVYGRLEKNPLQFPLIHIWQVKVTMRQLYLKWIISLFSMSKSIL